MILRTFNILGNSCVYIQTISLENLFVKTCPGTCPLKVSQNGNEIY